MEEILACTKKSYDASFSILSKRLHKDFVEILLVNLSFHLPWCQLVILTKQSKDWLFGFWQIYFKLTEIFLSKSENPVFKFSRYQDMRDIFKHGRFTHTVSATKKKKIIVEIIPKVPFPNVLSTAWDFFLSNYYFSHCLNITSTMKRLIIFLQVSIKHFCNWLSQIMSPTRSWQCSPLLRSVFQGSEESEKDEE